MFAEMTAVFSICSEILKSVYIILSSILALVELYAFVAINFLLSFSVEFVINKPIKIIFFSIHT